VGGGGGWGGFVWGGGRACVLCSGRGGGGGGGGGDGCSGGGERGRWSGRGGARLLALAPSVLSSGRGRRPRRGRARVVLERLGRAVRGGGGGGGFRRARGAKQVFGPYRGLLPFCERGFSLRARANGSVRTAGLVGLVALRVWLPKLCRARVWCVRRTGMATKSVFLGREPLSSRLRYAPPPRQSCFGPKLLPSTDKNACVPGRGGHSGGGVSLRIAGRPVSPQTA